MRIRTIACFVVCSIFCLSVANCANTQKKAPAQAMTEKAETAPEAPKPPEQKMAPYKINVGDVIEISVWRAKDMDKDVIVRPDGVISYPLVGDVLAVGLTLTELDRRLTERLTDYIRNPVVSIAIKRFGGTKVIVLGQVKFPGVYTPTGQGSVLEVIALAGGFTEDGQKDNTYLVRGGLENPTPIKLRLARAIIKGDMDENPPLAPNDIIYVPRNASATWNYVMRQITPTLSNVLLGTTIVRDIDAIHRGNP